MRPHKINLLLHGTENTVYTLGLSRTVQKIVWVLGESETENHGEKIMEIRNRKSFHIILWNFVVVAFVGVVLATTTSAPAAAGAVEDLYEDAKQEGELVLYMNDNLNSIQKDDCCVQE